MKLTKRESEIVDYMRKEAGVYRRAAEPKYMSEKAREHYRGMAHALDRVAGEILDGEHRAFAKEQPNAQERALGLRAPARV